MASKSSSRIPGGVPWTVIVPVVHVIVDLATHASCPNCESRVVLYVCINCKKPVLPRRGSATT
jgi:DNA-directed RNA polymerase subunit RPC12/RpoP